MSHDTRGLSATISRISVGPVFPVAQSSVLGDVECDGVPSYGVGSDEDLGYRSYEKGYQKRCKGEPVGSNQPP